MDIITIYASKIPCGYSKVQLESTVTKVTPPEGASRVIIQVEGQNIRFRDDSVDPTTTVGLAVNANGTFDLYSIMPDLRLISQALTSNGVKAIASLDSNAANGDIALEADVVGTAYNSYTFETVVDANDGANAISTLLSAAANSDLTLTAAVKGDDWNSYDFEIVKDATLGANAVATLNITAANGDLVFTAPTKDDLYNAHIFEANSDAAESISYTAVTKTFELNYIASTSNGSTMKTEFDSALVANPTWPQFTCAVEGDGSGGWEVGDDGANTTTANGVDPVVPYIEYSSESFTIHTYTTSTAADVVALWANGPNECTNWSCADEGNGSGQVDANTASSAGGIDVVAASVAYDDVNDTFTVHIVSGDTSNEVATLIDNAMTANPTWPQFEATMEGDGTGIVDAVSDVTVNGAQPVGAVVHLNFYRDKNI
jgi:hypothetical protein